MGWLPNSGNRVQHCIGRFIDEMGGIITVFMINAKKNTVAVMVLSSNEEAFINSPYFISDALIKKGYLRGRKVAWYTFDLTRFLSGIKERGLC